MKIQINDKSRLITVVRRDLSHGYQTAQTGHAIAEWAYNNPRTFRKWRKRSGYLICLSVHGLEHLEALMKSLDYKGIRYTKFYEPDVKQVTSIAISPSEEADKITKGLQLANVKAGTFDKNNQHEKAATTSTNSSQPIN